MPEMNREERTEEATQTRREDFRKRGQVANTKELGSVLLLFAAALMVWGLGRFVLQQFLEIYRHSLTDFLLMSIKNGEVKSTLLFIVKKITLILSPILLITLVIGLASHIVQVGFLNNEEAFDFKWEKLDPVQGLKKLFTLRSVMEGVKAVFKVILVSTVVFLLIRNEMINVPKVVTMSMEQLINYLSVITVRLLGGIALFMGLLAGVDYFFQRWELEKQMKMTKQEVKEEHKAREGDPLIKTRIRRIQREMANKRMMKDIPKADVIITNPTHIAVALSYDASMAAPTVIAKGAGFIAEKIKEIAKQHKITLVENKPLARTLYKTIKIGQSVPRELYKAIAEVLAYVYRVKKKRLN